MSGEAPCVSLGGKSFTPPPTWQMLDAVACGTLSCQYIPRELSFRFYLVAMMLHTGLDGLQVPVLSPEDLVFPCRYAFFTTVSPP